MKTKKENLDNTKYDFIPYRNSQSYRLGAEYEKSLNKKERVQLIQEVEREINTDYSDEL